MNKRGTFLIMSILMLVILFMLGSVFIFSTRSRRFERISYITHIQLFYIAEAGIIKGFHMLKANSFQNRFYLPNKGYQKKDKFSDGYYILNMKDINGKNNVLLESTAYYKDRSFTLKAIAYFGQKEKIIENNPYYLKRKIFELWRLEYIK